MHPPKKSLFFHLCNLEKNLYHACVKFKLSWLIWCQPHAAGLFCICVNQEWCTSSFTNACARAHSHFLTLNEPAYHLTQVITNGLQWAAPEIKNVTLLLSSGTTLQMLFHSHRKLNYNRSQTRKWLIIMNQYEAHFKKILDVNIEYIITTDCHRDYIPHLN